MATVILIGANILYFFISELSGPTSSGEVLLKWGALYTPYIAEEGQYWRFLTSMFLHSGIRHLSNNMITLYVLGQMLEQEAGKVRYLLIYFAGGLAGGYLEYYLSLRRGGEVMAVGASGAVFAVMGALLWVILINRGKIRGMTIQKMLLFVGFSVYFGLASSGVANAAHLGGLAAGFLLAILLYRRPHTGESGVLPPGNYIES